MHWVFYLYERCLVFSSSSFNIFLMFQILLKVKLLFTLFLYFPFLVCETFEDHKKCGETENLLPLFPPPITSRREYNCIACWLNYLSCHDSELFCCAGSMFIHLAQVLLLSQQLCVGQLKDSLFYHMQMSFMFSFRWLCLFTAY